VTGRPITGLGALALVAACGSTSQPLLKRAQPLNGSTIVDLSLIPTVEVAANASVDAADRHLVLYDVTAGARKTVAATIEVTGTTLAYRPKEPLPASHDFELVLERAAVSGEKIDEIDASEWPDEPIAWPYRLWFSTKSRPRVRAAYLEPQAQRITIYFSQPMDPVTSSPQIQVVDLAQKAWPANAPAWDSGNRVARLGLKAALDAATPYTLRVGSDATAENATRLDGNDDGVVGGTNDGWSAPFTGSQAVILSRQRRP
jgi:hypothetical protein